MKKFSPFGTIFLALLVLIAGSGPVLAHGPDGHGEKEQISEATTSVTLPAESASAAKPDLGDDEPLTEAKLASTEATSGVSSALRALHPATVHFPIAFFLLAGLLEAISMARRRSDYRGTVNILVVAGAVGAAVAALFGWIHTGLWFGGDLSMQWHRWTGTGVALAGLFMVSQIGREHRRVLRGFLALTCIALLAQGYWGGELAHGPGHLLSTLYGDTHEHSIADPHPASPRAGPVACRMCRRGAGDQHHDVSRSELRLLPRLARPCGRPFRQG